MKRFKSNIKVFPLIFSIVIVITYLLFEMLKRNSYLIEKILPNRQILTIKSYIFGIFGPIDFSVAEFLIYISAILIIIFFIYFIINIIKSKNKVWFVINFSFVVIIIIGILYIFFMMFCGIDYYRPSIEQKLHLQVRKYERQELIKTCNILLTNLNTASDKVKRDENGLFASSLSESQIFAFSNQAYKNIINEGIVENIEFSKPKGVYLSEALNYLSIRGFYFPYTGEANINIKDGVLFLPFVICHEKAHQYGIMREQEANFVAFLACIKSGNSDFVYSGYLEAFTTVLNQVYTEDKDEYNSIILKLDEKIKKDINDYNKKAIKYKSVISDMAGALNNSYLISQGQKDGIKSYGKMVDLLISSYSK